MYLIYYNYTYAVDVETKLNEIIFSDIFQDYFII